MKILLTTESYHPNIDGGAIAQHRLVAELIKKGHDVRVVAPGEHRTNITEKDEETHSLVHRPRSMTLPFYMDNRYHFAPFPYYYIKNIIEEFKPDLINTCSPYPNSLSAHHVARKKDIPVVGSIHMLPENMLSPWMEKRYYPTIKKISWKYLINYYNRVDQATIPTQTGKEMYKEQGLTTEVTPISNGVDTEKFKPSNKGDYLKEKYGLPDKPTAIYTGRLCAEKNLDVLIKAIPKVLKNVDSHFIFVGSGGGYKEKMKHLAEQLKVSDHITFTDFLPWEDYYNIYDTADLFVIPAESELQSIVTLEAIACGLPAVVVDAGAVPELVSNDNGYIFKAQDSKDLSKKISSILMDKKLQKKMSKNSLELVKSHSMDYISSQFESVYKKTLELYSKTH